MCLKKISFIVVLPLLLVNCANNSVKQHTDAGFVTRNNIVIKKSEAADDSFKKIYPFLAAERALCAIQPEITYVDRFRRVTKIPNKACNHPYDNVLSLWTLMPSQSIDEALHTKRGQSLAVQFRFGQDGVAAIPVNSSNHDSCFFLTNAKGDLVPIRDNGADDPYLFANPLLKPKHATLMRDSAISSARSSLNGAKRNLASAKQALYQNRAWEKQQQECVKPIQRPLPAMPHTLSMEEARYQAHGFCAEISARRTSPLKVADALASIFKDDVIRDWARWRKNPENWQSCAKVMRSQIEDWFSNLCGILGPFGSRGCSQNLIEKCITQSIDQCTGALTDWKRKVTRIKAEPGMQYRACLQQQKTVEQFQASLPMLETRQRVAKSIPVPPSATQTRVSLRDAVCASNQGGHYVSAR